MLPATLHTAVLSGEQQIMLCAVQEADDSKGWQKAGPVQSGVPRHWGSVRCGCIEGVLATAILAGQHADVWDAAGLLLREHYKCLPPLTCHLIHCQPPLSVTAANTANRT